MKKFLVFFFFHSHSGVVGGKLFGEIFLRQPSGKIITFIPDCPSFHPLTRPHQIPKGRSCEVILHSGFLSLSSWGMFGSSSRQRTLWWVLNAGSLSPGLSSEPAFPAGWSPEALGVHSSPPHFEPLFCTRGPFLSTATSGL